MSRTSQGRSIANLLSFQPNEKIANVLAVKISGPASSSSCSPPPRAA